MTNGGGTDVSEGCFYTSVTQSFVCVQEQSTENGGGSQALSECEDLKQEQSRISRLERQAQDFLNAVFHRKGNTRTQRHFFSHAINRLYIPSGQRNLDGTLHLS